ncbi:hypothetical protein SB780_38905, partial [Burkholderia sp. SIMBA_057]
RLRPSCISINRLCDSWIAVEREIKILTLAEKKGQLVNAEQLERAYGQMVGAFQSDLLSLPDKIAQEMRTLYGVDVDVELLNEHV